MKIPEARRSEISRIVLERSRASIAELSAELNVSEETVRRDLNILQVRGNVLKVHGGAIPPDHPAQGAYEKRKKQQISEKLKIADAAVELIPSGASVMIDAGSTTEAFAGRLALSGTHTIITNSMGVTRGYRIAAEGGQVIFLGGEVRWDMEETLGEVAINQLQTFNADHAVLTVAGISEDGQFMRYRLDQALLARAMIEQARQVTIVADHTKFDNRTAINICQLKHVTNLVTDRPISRELREKAEAAGTNIIVTGD